MIEIEVTYNDHSQGYFPINPEEGWRVNPAQRCLVIGHGVPRIHVPLDNVLYFTLLEKPDPREEALRRAYGTSEAPEIPMVRRGR
jgi:hypothetical protein